MDSRLNLSVQCTGGAVCWLNAWSDVRRLLNQGKGTVGSLTILHDSVSNTKDISRNRSSRDKHSKSCEGSKTKDNHSGGTASKSVPRGKMDGAARYQRWTGELDTLKALGFVSSLLLLLFPRQKRHTISKTSCKNILQRSLNAPLGTYPAAGTGLVLCVKGSSQIYLLVLPAYG